MLDINGRNAVMTTHIHNTHLQDVLCFVCLAFLWVVLLLRHARSSSLPKMHSGTHAWILYDMLSCLARQQRASWFKHNCVTCLYMCGTLTKAGGPVAGNYWTIYLQLIACYSLLLETLAARFSVRVVLASRIIIKSIWNINDLFSILNYQYPNPMCLYTSKSDTIMICRIELLARH